MIDLKKTIREIPDYPKKGISFKDITTLLKDKNAFSYILDNNVNKFKNCFINKVIGIEARGFITGGAIAKGLDAGFVPVRKKGKLPYKTFSESYQLEYGQDSIEIHIDALTKNDIVLIHDDLLATGGTSLAVLNLVKRIGISKIYFSFICDLEFIQSSEKNIIYGYKPFILVKYFE
jgi:adenine phosphoribosyltransferase